MQVRKGIALPVGDEDWLKPEMVAQLSLTGLRQVRCVRCACCGMLCGVHWRSICRVGCWHCCSSGK